MGFSAFRYHGRAMADLQVRTRFAPSPTGELHLGNARTALFNALLARREGGRFLLRIEDTDVDRSREAYVAALQEDLRWLGLRWEGFPDADGEPLRQSRQSDIYAHYFCQLQTQGAAYPCFCSPEELAAVRQAQRAGGQPPRYPGTCAGLNQQDVEARSAQGARPTLRFRVPSGETVAFDDLVRGQQVFRTDDIGDFIIRRADGTAAFFFSNALDDALMAISHVLRGEDHIANTPRQLLLLRALGLQEPHYGHLALIVGPDSRPLSKRHGDSSLRELREAGYLPYAVNNYLARLGHAYAREDLLTITELAEGFDLRRLGRAPAQHNETQLHYWQREAIAATTDAALWAWLSEYAHEGTKGINQFVPDEQALAFSATIRENVQRPHEAMYWAKNFFGGTLERDAEAIVTIRSAGAAFFKAALRCMEDDPATFQEFSRSVGKLTGVKGKRLFMPLRAAMTGFKAAGQPAAGWQHGPELGRIWSLLGVATVHRRLQAALSHCE